MTGRRFSIPAPPLVQQQPRLVYKTEIHREGKPSLMEEYATLPEVVEALGLLNLGVTMHSGFLAGDKVVGISLHIDGFHAGASE